MGAMSELPVSPGSATSRDSLLDMRRLRWSYVIWRACCVMCLVTVVIYPILIFLFEAKSSITDVEQLRDKFREKTLPLVDVASSSIRTSYHFQPGKNWMNDPNGPVFYKGYYHFFYQYNPNGTVWGDIVWGHAVSTDLIHWLHLDVALAPDQWYDAAGVWSGSVTVREDGVPIIIYTGAAETGEQTQNLAYPEDPYDALLRRWVKDADNPVLRHPDGIASRDFRDPTTAWKGADGRWLMTVGAKRGRTGVALLYQSADLKHWELQDTALHAAASTGMWECVDFFPVPLQGRRGLDAYIAAPAVKYVLKASFDEEKRDYYALGSYDVVERRFYPDTGLELRYDYGKFYASKTFFDPATQRRVLWGWVNESDSARADVAKGWASVQAIPRSVWFDSGTRRNLVQAPVEELKTLRGARVSLRDLRLAPRDVVQVGGALGAQIDIELVFDHPNITHTLDMDEFDCVASHRGVLGPFGLLVMADKSLMEQTAIFFYISYSKSHNKWMTKFCSDQTRSSLLSDVDTSVYGSFVEVLPSEDFLSLRVLVDGSIVESFAQGGRVVITSRVYPTIAAQGQPAHLYLFNNGTAFVHVRSIDAWQMNSVPLRTI